MTEPVKLQVATFEQRANEFAVKSAKQVLELCEKGEIEEILIIGKRPSGDWDSWRSPCYSVTNMIGSLMVIVFDLLYKNREQEDSSPPAA